MLLINFSFEEAAGYWNLNSLETLGALIGGYALCLILIFLQGLLLKTKRPARIEKITSLSSLELLLYFFFVLLVLGAPAKLPWLKWSLTLLSASAIALYLIGLALARFSAEADKTLRTLKAKAQVQFIIPFLIPYFVLTLLLDLGDHLLSPHSEWAAMLAALLLLIFSLFFLPYFLQKFWQCTPLPSSDLHSSLEKICKRARFKHGGMMVWTVMGNSLTAAIIGLIPRFRYVMFTPKLLQMLAQEHIEAVLAHEIGHSKHHHLLLYPLIILGMMVSVALFFNIFSASIDWSPIAIFLVYVLIMGLYFRFVFGYFSRLFERQADVYGFQLGLSLNSMIGALDHIAIAAGNIHHHPSWHHFGIQKRIDYLNQVAENPKLIDRHNRKVHISLGIYFALLALGIFLLIWYQ